MRPGEAREPFRRAGNAATDRSDAVDGSGSVPPLAREWLPRPRPPADAPEWETRTRRILAAAEPVLRELEAAGDGAPVADDDVLPWPMLLGSWWRPTAGLAAAAILALLFLGSPRTDSGAQASERIYLGLVAADGAPDALWAALGIEADPVLAALVLDEGER